MASYYSLKTKDRVLIKVVEFSLLMKAAKIKA
jgi:hypothetical protein